MKKFIQLVFLTNLAIIFYFWLDNSGYLLVSGVTADFFIALGRITGLLAVFFVLLQLVLIGRVQWLETVFGLDKLAVLHHWNGFLSLLFILTHPIFITWGYAIKSHQSFASQFFDLAFHWEKILPALGAVILFVLVVILSLVIVKQKLKYEVWHFIHLFTYLAILLAFGHQLELGGDFNNQLFAGYWYFLYLLAIGHVVLFRLLAPWYNFFRFHFKVLKIEQETEDAVSIYIGGKNFSNFKYQPGQFMIFRFLNKKAWWQAHPFSISSSPNGGYLRVTIKNLGDFTGSVKEKIKSGDFVLLEGPYGIFTASRNSREKILLVAGGVGITPLRPLAEDLLKQHKDVVLVYAAKNLKNLIFKKELEGLSRDKGLKTHLVLSQDFAPPHQQGRLDKEMIMRLVPDIKDREIYLCGPQGLTRALLKELKQLSLASSLLHYEKFSLS